MLFQMVLSITQMFPSLNPLVLRQYEAIEVIQLIQKIMKSSQISEPKHQRKKVYADQVNWF